MKLETLQFIELLKKLCADGAFIKAHEILDQASGQINEPDWHILQAQVYAEANNKQAAESSLRLALEKYPDNWKCRLNLARLVITAGDTKAGRREIEKAYKIAPAEKEVCKTYVNFLLDQADLNLSLECATRYLDEVDSEDEFFRLARASSLRALGRKSEALELIEACLTSFKDPSYLSTLKRVKADLIAEDDTLAGIHAYREALDAQKQLGRTDDIQTQWNMCLHLLRAREFKQGWEYWELGLNPKVGSMGRKIPRILVESGIPNLQSIEALKKDQWLLLMTEQGIGDQVLFMTAMPRLLQYTERVLLISDPRLIGIWSRTFPGLAITKPGYLENLGYLRLPSSQYLAMGSLLPLLASTSDQMQALKRSWLKPDLTLTSTFRQKLLEMAKGKPIVGISWSGGHWMTQKAQKVNDLANWGPILQRKAFFVVLQYGDISSGLAELDRIGCDYYIEKNFDFKEDLESWFALAMACDGVISVSTALIHFCGAAGQTVFILMPRSQGPWHLGLVDFKHILYPNVRIYRPKNSESAPDYYERVANLIRI